MSSPFTVTYGSLDTRLQDDPDWVAASDSVKSTFICFWLFMVKRGDGNIVKGGASWTNVQWLKATGRTRKQIMAAGPFVSVQGGDVVLQYYPAEMERQLRERAEVARRNGQKGGRRPFNGGADPTRGTGVELPFANPAGTQPVPCGIPKRAAEAVPGSAAASASVISKSKEVTEYIAPGPAPDGLFEALAGAEGSEVTHLTKSGASRILVALSEIRAACPAVTVEEIAARVRAYRRVMPPGSRLTAHALAKNWAKCGISPKPAEVQPCSTVPEGWREALEAIRPGNMINQDGRGWDTLPPAIQDEVRGHITAQHQPAA